MGIDTRTSWIVALPTLSALLCSPGGNDAVELVRRIARTQWTWLNGRLNDCTRTLTTLVATPPRSPGDWSIATRFATWARDLAWLRENAKAFISTTARRTRGRA